jgi:predicted peptidase
MATSGENGSISPSSLAGYVWVNDGEDVTFTFNPAFGFEVDKVTVNDVEVAVTDNTYTIQNVTASGIKIHATFKPDSNATVLPFTVYNDIFSVGNVTTAVIIDLGEGNAANLADLSAVKFTAAARNTRLNGSTVIFDGMRNITRVYVNNDPEPLGYISPAPGSDDLVTDTPASGRYIIVEFEFWNANGYTSGSMVSGTLQNAFSAILNYRVNVDREIKLTDGTSIIPRFTQAAVVNPALDKFVPDKTNPGGTGSMDILISIDDSWEDQGPLPLFIYNHGGGRGGSSGDYFAPMQTANGAAVLSKLQLENPGKYNAHIIATQNHSDNQANNAALMAYVKNLAAEGKVDLNRIYMSGFSMGSMYTAGFFNRNPEFLAAIVLESGGDLPTVAQLTANPEYTKTAVWAFTHKDDFMGNTWTNYFSTGAGASGLYEEANATILNTNQAFNYPYYGFDWTPHETEAQAYSNLIGQSNALHRYGPSQEKYADKNIFDWMFAQFRSENRIEDLKEVVAGLDLDNGNRNALTVKLDQASKLLGNTKENKSAEAIEVLNGFIDQVNAFVNPGKLSEEQAKEMTLAAEETIRYINYMNKLR